ncbi:hypothetical protein BH09VER1_BH09VER1_40540 [soil metagenome]
MILPVITSVLLMFFGLSCVVAPFLKTESRRISTEFR